MKAYISPSIADDEQDILSALSTKIRRNGFIPIAGYHKFGQQNNQLAFHEIKKAQGFVGLVAEGGEELDRVYDEWQHALKSTPALLLVESTIRTDKYPLLNKHPDVIRFNRSSKKELNKTIQMVRSKISSASSRKESPFIREAAWFICGPIALDFLSMLPVHSF